MLARVPWTNNHQADLGHVANPNRFGDVLADLLLIIFNGRLIPKRKNN